ncbi:TATA box-binding protein-associated factor RNA polymerase I subunit A-like [Ylistrum balloti]|uniref:TATA box-binding protein-associated factor RNA polymerase I subunit A-like n=1 Tax=Ylistrum balloti TaxID=509963 RepID=UPI002905BAB4|nr:TATA box-binding protein-associated factor RNA polymerase I subunit A-like [Ylistrum balloti]
MEKFNEMESEDQQNTNIDDSDLMKDVCELLMGDSMTLENADQTHCTAVDWFKNWATTFQHQNYQSSLLHPYLVTVLRDYLLMHAWKNSLAVLRLLGDDPNHTAISLWKVGMEIMYSNPDKNKGLIEHYVRKLKEMSDLEIKDVILEYVMYLLHKGELDEAKHAMLDIPKLKGAKKWDREKFPNRDLVFQAYQGLLYYTHWNLDRQHLTSQSTQMDEDEFRQGLYYSDTDTLKDSAERAIACFSQLYDHLGVWDIFITKHVQILEHYYRLEEAKTVLEKYRDRNKENPNTHKYLCSFCVKHKLLTRECETQLLKAVADSIPSDRMVMDLCDRFIEDKNISDLLFYIFELKDYKCWQNDVRSWRILSTAIQLALDNDNQDIIKLHWNPRESWWPAYHFNNTANGTSDQGGGAEMGVAPDIQEIWVHRVCCAAMLVGPDDSFVSSVRGLLNRKQIQSLKEVTKKVITSGGIT